ncbi:MAG: prepilin peptidase [Alphaproteobacteria bacterium]|nr:prepilin peptidase [Alphaproteobacteria bacterium]
MADIAFLVPYPVQLFIVVVFALVLGSFASALAYRTPRHIGWGLLHKTRSACPQCDKTLTALELIPLLSWLVQRGKCRGCSHPIPVAYPLIEFACLVIGLGIYFVFGFTLIGLSALLAVPFLVALLAVDLKYMILPNTLVAALAVAGLLYHCAVVLSGETLWIDVGREFIPAALLYGFFILGGWAGLCRLCLKRRLWALAMLSFLLLPGFGWVFRRWRRSV